jgi:hypothetical protein
VELAASAIDSGKARGVLQSIVSFSKSLRVAEASS